MKKSVVISLAGAAAALVAGWRRIQRDSLLPETPVTAESAPPAGGPPPAPPTPAAPTPATSTVSEASSKAELYEIARRLGIEGRSKMSKAGLLEAIRAAQP